MENFIKKGRGFGWSKGLKISDEQKIKISESLKGRIPWNKGIKTGPNPEHSKRMKGKKFSDEHKRKISQSNIGKKISEKNKENLRLKMGGKNHWRWYQDRTKLKRQEDRRSSAVDEWRKNIYKRDGYKCKFLNKDCKGRIEAHHILNWEDFPELRYNIDNGITLCHTHHPRGREKEKQLSPYLQELLLKSKAIYE